MGLASALTTALTGMTAAETQIDVVGNNLANAQTIGFKGSQAVFATQFLQTQGLGSSPTESSGGTNPRQFGLGALTAEITPDFTQGTIEISSNPSDLAIQGEGFFMVAGSAGEVLYSRNGQFKTNSNNELVSVTGNRLLGFGVDEFFDVQTTQLVPIAIPLGSASVAQATQNVFLEGTLTPTGDVADTAQVVESAVLGDLAVPRPDASGVTISIAPTPNLADAGTALAETDGTGSHNDGDTFSYRFAFVDDSGAETLASETRTITLTGGGAFANDSAIELTNIPQDTSYQSVKVYRTAAGGSDFFELVTLSMGDTDYQDNNSVALTANALPPQTTIDGNYEYLITYHRDGEEESRPSLALGPINVIDSRVHIRNLPTPPAGGTPEYDQIRIYRTLKGNPNEHFLVATLDPGESFTDNMADEVISDLEIVGNKTIDYDGPKVDSNTLLVNVLSRDGLGYENLFQEGALSFAGRKGGRTLERKDFEISATTTVQDLMNFMEDALGIQDSIDDPANSIPGSVNTIAGETGTLTQGVEVRDGRLRIVSNNGIDNAISIPLSAFQVDPGDGTISNPSFSFGTIQAAVGQSAATDFIVYDTLGVPTSVRVTTVLESRSGSATTYRWFADSPDNDPLSGTDISVGTGLISFDGEGNFMSSTNSTVSIEKRNSPASSPLEFNLDFDQISGLAANSSDIAAARQDGSSTGTLTSFIIGEDGVIRGVFSNGATRNLGQLRLARFGNPQGLEQVGQNMFAAGINSGLPVEGNPGEQGIGGIISGAVELSNTDVGANLIDLVLATTQYRGNTRVISTAQELFDELLNLRR